MHHWACPSTTDRPAKGLSLRPADHPPSHPLSSAAGRRLQQDRRAHVSIRGEDVDRCSSTVSLDRLSACQAVARLERRCDRGWPRLRRPLRRNGAKLHLQQPTPALGMMLLLQARDPCGAARHPCSIPSPRKRWKSRRQRRRRGPRRTRRRTRKERTTSSDRPKTYPRVPLLLPILRSSCHPSTALQRPLQTLLQSGSAWVSWGAALSALCMR